LVKKREEKIIQKPSRRAKKKIPPLKKIRRKIQMEVSGKALKREKKE